MKKLITVIFILVCFVMGFMYHEYTKNVPTLTLYETNNPNMQLNEITKNTKNFEIIPKNLKKYDNNVTYWLEVNYNKNMDCVICFVFYEGFIILDGTKINTKIEKGNTLYSFIKTNNNDKHFFKIINIRNPSVYIKSFGQYRKWSSNSFTHSHNIFAGAILGLMFMVFLYNISIYIYIREKSFLYYSLMQLSMLPVIFYHTNFVFFNQYYYNFFALLASFFSIYFVQNFFNTKKNLPKLHKVLIGYILFSILDLIHLLYDKSSWIFSENMYGTFALLYLIIAYLRMKQDFFPAKLFLIGWSIFIVSLLITERFYSLRASYTFINELPMMSIFLLGPIGESFFFSIALAYKWMILQNEKKEQELILIQQTRRASLGEQITFISHQWKGPLHGLQMMISNTQNENENDTLTKEKLRKKLDRATNRIQFMSDTINWFQSFYSTNKKREKFSINTSTKELISMMKDMFIEKNIDIIVDVRQDFTIESYKNEYQQVLLNLLMNSKYELLNRNIKYPKIYITISTKLITISDNAGGIKNQNIHEIFNQDVTSKNSLGIGLYMSKKIIEESMGGTLKVENGVDGAIFSIHL